MMDENTYVKHYHKGHKFESSYERKLENLLNDEGYIKFHPVIKLMLVKKSAWNRRELLRLYIQVFSQKILLVLTSALISHLFQPFIFLPSISFKHFTVISIVELFHIKK